MSLFELPAPGPTSPNPNATYYYRLTPDEYARYLSERDALATGDWTDTIVSNGMQDVRLANGRWVIDGTHASASFDAGFYWVRTRKEITWL